jgi:hypothetical protein
MERRDAGGCKTPEDGCRIDAAKDAGKDAVAAETAARRRMGLGEECQVTMIDSVTMENNSVGYCINIDMSIGSRPWANQNSGAV